MRVGVSKDKRHYARKAVWLPIVALLFIPHLICYGAAKLDEWLYGLSNKVYRFAHPCLYKKPGETTSEYRARVERGQHRKAKD